MRPNDLTISAHLLTERVERLTYILSQPDLCDLTPAIEVPIGNKREVLTIDGVLLVKAATTEFVITAYLPSINKVYAMYQSIGRSHIPDQICKKVNKNRRTHAKRAEYLLDK